jgi:hypothetical protein
MDREAAVMLEVRLTALEFFVTKLSAAIIVGSGGTVQTAETAMREQLARQQTFPTLDPVISDFASAELNEALEKLLKMQVELVAQLIDARGRQ